MGECAQSLPDRFRFSHVQRWFAAYYPDINERTLRVHLIGLTEAENNPNPYLAKKPVLFRRIAHGEYEVIGRGHRTTEPGEPDQAAPHESPPAAEMARPGPVVLIGYEHAQRTTPGRARDLFTAPEFSVARDRAEANGSPWFALSSEYGLLRPQAVISPYSRRLSGESATFRRAWARWVMAVLDSELDEDLADARIALRLEEDFVEPLSTLLESQGTQLASSVVAFSDH